MRRQLGRNFGSDQGFVMSDADDPDSRHCPRCGAEMVVAGTIPRLGSFSELHVFAYTRCRHVVVVYDVRD